MKLTLTDNSIPDCPLNATGLKKKLQQSEERYNKLLHEYNEKVEHELELRMLSEMTRISSELAHDLRSPLQTITNSVFLMEKKGGDIRYIPRINEALKRATSLLDGFRDYYRGHETTPMKSNVNKLLTMALEDFPVPMSIIVKKNLDPKILDQPLDMNKIRQVFRHIIKNGVEAMPDGGTISIQTKDMPDKVLVTIKDSGKGILEADRDKIFKAFGLKKKGGLGLGLAASKRIVEAHGGTISFGSEVDSGTTFIIELPK